MIAVRSFTVAVAIIKLEVTIFYFYSNVLLFHGIRGTSLDFNCYFVYPSLCAFFLIFATQ